MDHADLRPLDGIRPEALRSEELMRDRAGQRPEASADPTDHVQIGETPLIAVDEVILQERRRRRRRRRRRLYLLRQTTRLASSVPGCWAGALAEEPPT